MSAVARYIMATSEGRAEELGALFRELGPEAQEAYVTIAEQIAAQAEARGQSSMLLKLLTLRFGPIPETLRARVRAAAPEQLDRWAERVLSAHSLDEVLDG